MRKQTCLGCIENAPDQYYHSLYGGCMFLDDSLMTGDSMEGPSEEDNKQAKATAKQLVLLVKENKFINVKNFLENNEVDINFEDNGKTLLEIAIENKNIAIIKLLIKFGINYYK